MARGEIASIIILGFDEVIPWILVRAHDDVNSLAEMKIELVDLHRLYIVSSIKSH